LQQNKSPFQIPFSLQYLSIQYCQFQIIKTVTDLRYLNSTPPSEIQAEENGQIDSQSNKQKHYHCWIIFSTTMHINKKAIQTKMLE